MYSLKQKESEIDILNAVKLHKVTVCVNVCFAPYCSYYYFSISWLICPCNCRGLQCATINSNTTMHFQEDTTSISSKSNSLASQQSLQSCEVSSSLSSINSLPPQQPTVPSTGASSLTPSPPAPPRHQQQPEKQPERAPAPEPPQPQPQQPQPPPVTTFSRHSTRNQAAVSGPDFVLLLKVIRCISFLPKSSGQCYLDGSGNFGNLGSNKDIQPKFVKKNARCWKEHFEMSR